MQYLSLTPLFLAFLSQSFRILFVAVHLFSSPVLRASSVAAIPSPLKTQYGCYAVNNKGSAAACVYARLLKRLSCGTVTVFEPCAKSNFLHFSYGVSAIAGSPPYHSVSTFYAPHTNTLSARPSCQTVCFSQC